MYWVLVTTEYCATTTIERAGFEAGVHVVVFASLVSAVWRAREGDAAIECHPRSSCRPHVRELITHHAWHGPTQCPRPDHRPDTRPCIAHVSARCQRAAHVSARCQLFGTLTRPWPAFCTPVYARHHLSCCHHPCPPPDLAYF